MATKAQSITFLRRHVVQDENAGTAKQTVFEADRTYRVSPETARHYVSRGIARFGGKRVRT